MKTITPVELQKILTGPAGISRHLTCERRWSLRKSTFPRPATSPLDELKPGSLPLPKDQPVYLLCRSGRRATKAAEKLAKEGFSQPIVVEGGTLAWIEASLPVTRNATKVISLERQVRIAAGAIVFTGVLLARFVNPHFIWLSGFVGAGLVFAGITDYCGMGLLLARMPWNRKA